MYFVSNELNLIGRESHLKKKGHRCVDRICRQKNCIIIVQGFKKIQQLLRNSTLLKCIIIA